MPALASLPLSFVVLTPNDMSNPQLLLLPRLLRTVRLPYYFQQFDVFLVHKRVEINQGVLRFFKLLLLVVSFFPLKYFVVLL